MFEICYGKCLYLSFDKESTQQAASLRAKRSNLELCFINKNPHQMTKLMANFFHICKYVFICHKI